MYVDVIRRVQICNFMVDNHQSSLKGFSMADWKMPPMAKIYEALGAVADERVSFTSATSARVESSSRDKTYNVGWSGDMREITSDDNASRWQGYTGYPIIAVLLKTGKISFDPLVARELADIPWNALNKKFRHDYDRAVNHVLEGIEAGGGNRARTEAEAGAIYEQLVALKLQRLQSGRKGG